MHTRRPPLTARPHLGRLGLAAVDGTGPGDVCLHGVLRVFVRATKVSVADSSAEGTIVALTF